MLKDLLHKHKHLQQSTADSTTHTDSPYPARRSTDQSKRTDSGLSSAGPELAPKVFDEIHPIPEFTFLRTTTNDQEIIAPPHYPEDDVVARAKRADEKKTPEKKRRSLFRNRSGTIPSRTPSNQSVKSVKSTNGRTSEDEHENGSPSPIKSADGLTASAGSPMRPEMKRKLSDRLGLSSRARSQSRASDVSPNLPDDLGDPPQPAPAPLEGPDAKGKVKEWESKEARAQREELWERRACKLAMGLHVPSAGPWGMVGNSTRPDAPGRKRSGTFVDEKEDGNIQEAIRLHESGNLDRSTAIFGRLADPKRANNPLSQVLYGLALRHGWGIEPSYDYAILYLSLAARTAAQIQQMSSVPGAGEARGELVLAMFELGNCYRQGWGCKIDKIAARVFYEVAANLGDPDALEETAWCFMEGYGGGKDKVSFACYDVFHFISRLLPLWSRFPAFVQPRKRWCGSESAYLGHLCRSYAFESAAASHQSRPESSVYGDARFTCFLSCPANPVGIEPRQAAAYWAAIWQPDTATCWPSRATCF